MNDSLQEQTIKTEVSEGTQMNYDLHELPIKTEVIEENEIEGIICKDEQAIVKEELLESANDEGMDGSIFYGRKRPSASVNENEDESEDTSGSEFLPGETYNDSSCSSNASSDHESVDDVLDDESCEDHENLEPPTVQSEWTAVCTSNRSFPFTGKEAMKVQPPTEGSPLPIDIFNLLVDDEVIEHIVSETNKFASQCIANTTITRRSTLNNWKDTNAVELKQLFGTLIYMGLVPKPEIALYWSKSVLYTDQFVPKVMTRERFQALLRFVHFNDNSGALAKQDKLHKIRPLVDLMRNKYQEVYDPGADLVIDESMVAFRGRVGIRQYLPGKTHKYGLKIYKVCTPDAYTWNFDIHCGRNTNFEGLIGTESLTVSLTQKLFNIGSTLYYDNYYSSIGLAEYLLEKKTYMCGTIRRNRKYLSKDVIGAKLKRNEMKCLQNNKGVKVYNWKDKRNVFMISTVPEHGGCLVPSGKSNRNGEDVQKPECVLAYNKAKKGVDVSGQMTSYHTPLCRSLKWYRKLAFEIITGISVVNAYVLYNKYFADKPMQIRQFRDSLVLSLTGIAETDVRPGRAPSAIRGTPLAHVLSEGDKKNKQRKRCRGCYEKISMNENYKIARNKARRVVTFCAQCEGKPHLCVTCFAEKHETI